MVNELFFFFIFPGLLFSFAAGSLLSWFDRKITARVQFRKGPPLLQPFYDFVKLLGKEVILPQRGSKAVFLMMPVIAVIGATAAAVFILLPLFRIRTGFAGDILVIVYLLNIPFLSLIIGAAASANPFSAVGASREIKLMVSYEIPFLFSLLIPVMKSGMSIRLFDILQFQAERGAVIGSISGVIGFLVAVFCLQAKLGWVPFDLAEAETEICEGIVLEYSGAPYALIKLARHVLLFALSSLLAVMFLGGFDLHGLGILWSILKLLAVVLLLTLIRNTNPRVKIAQAMRFFWIGLNLLAVAGIIVAVLKL